LKTNVIPAYAGTKSARDVIPAYAGIQLRRLVCFVAILALACFATSLRAQASVKCTVLDPELKGSYTGDCREGLAEGYGEAIGTARYKGEFRAGRKHGKGVKSWPSGDRYEGDFVEDRKEGSGTYAWGPRSAWAGEKYSGQYVADRRHGEGVYEWPKGERYSGPWKNDMIVGKATPTMLARARAYAEHMAAVGKVGAKVCREMTVGIAQRDWIRGVVSERIQDAGKFLHTLNGVEIVRDAVVWDAPTAWVPCL
jgi:hypothetical protein